MNGLRDIRIACNKGVVRLHERLSRDLVKKQVGCHIL
jgi:hypothetical protein